MHKEREWVHWPKLLAGAMISLVLGLGTHVVMITFLHIPYPSDPPVAGVLLFGNRVLIVLGALLLYGWSELARCSFATPWKVLLYFVLLTTVTERLLRVPLMNGFVTTAWTYSFLQVIPKLVPWLVLAGLVALTNPRWRETWRVAVVAVVGAGIVYLVVAPLATVAFKPVLAKLAYLDHDEVYPFPYGWQVTTAAFVTYVEPVTACLVAAALTWKRLPSRPFPKVVFFALLVTMVRGSVLSPLAYACKHSDRFWPALVSDGQFALESVVLGLLSGVTWMVARSRQPADVERQAGALLSWNLFRTQDSKSVMKNLRETASKPIRGPLRELSLPGETTGRNGLFGRSAHPL